MADLRDEIRDWMSRAFGLEFSADSHVERLERLLLDVDQAAYETAMYPPDKPFTETRIPRICAALAKQKERDDG